MARHRNNLSNRVWRWGLVAVMVVSFAGQACAVDGQAVMAADAAGGFDGDLFSDGSQDAGGEASDTTWADSAEVEEAFTPPATVVPWPSTTCVDFDAAGADPSAALFPSDCLLDIDLTLASADWEVLRRQSRTVLDVLTGDCLAQPPADIFTWFSGTATIGGRSLTDVGIRKKGFLGSLSETKPSLKLRFDKFTDGRRLAGMKRMTLNNVQQDPSLLNACLGYSLMAQAGIPAPRCAFARIRMNSVDLGIYVHVDSIKSAFLERHFGNSDGNLYEGTLSDFRQLFVGTFEKKTNEVQANWSDIDAVVAALMDGEDTPGADGVPQFVEALEPLLDVDAFFRFWAAETLIGHWDGYAGNANNYYVYRYPVGGATAGSAATSDSRFRFIPWGIDAAFGPPPPPTDGGPLPPESVFATGVLSHRLYNTPWGRQRYLEALGGLLESVWDEAAIRTQIEAYEALLAPAIPPVQQGPWAAAVNARKTWVAARRARILDEQTPVAPAWEQPLRPSVCWPVAGEVTASFEAAWGAPGLDPLSSGGSLQTTVAAIGGPLGNVSSSARVGTGDDELGEALIEIVAQGPGDTYVLLRVIGPTHKLAPNTSHPIDWQGFRGYIGAFIPLQNSFEAFGLLADGVLSFTQASTIPGSVVIGELGADVVVGP